jgi:TRAP-type C4-dicarboxylate transport system permease small subunit
LEGAAMNPDTHRKIALILDLAIKTSSIVMIVLAFDIAMHNGNATHVMALGFGSVTFAIHGYGK